VTQEGGTAAQQPPTAQPEAAQQPSLDELAEKVYWKLRDRLRVERERAGAPRRR
jgi:hypothetical protein